jgi:D-sedoheptulose 7-phosphate isomerase
MTTEPAERLAERRIRESIETQQALLDASVLSAVAREAELIVDALRDGGTVLAFGNGGSAADATHFAAELVGRYLLDRDGLLAISLSDNPSAVTAISNDYGYERVFARQVEALGRPGDVALGISTSGRSANVLAGLESARASGLTTVVLTGGEGGSAGKAADVCIAVPSDETPARPREAHPRRAHPVRAGRAGAHLSAVFLDRDGVSNVKAREAST